MAPATKFYLVSAEALPEIFIKVAEAKRMLQSGEVRTAGDAARAVGISRSAFYKYRDAVRPFNDMKTGRIITFYTMLKNNPGVLSNVLSIFAGSGANILTMCRGDDLGRDVRNAGVDRGDDGAGACARWRGALRYPRGLSHAGLYKFIRWIGSG